MAIQTSAGSTVAISAALPTTNNATGFGAVTGWAVIGEVTDVPSYGREYSQVDFVDLGTRRKRKLKGSYDNGTIDLTMGKSVGDAGQVLLKDALDDDSDYSFRITYQDGSIDYFQGMVMSFKSTIGGPDNVVTANCTVSINQDVVEVAAP